MIALAWMGLAAVVISDILWVFHLIVNRRDLGNGFVEWGIANVAVTSLFIYLAATL